MKNTQKNKIKAMLTIALSVLLCAVLSLLSFSAEDDFESEIAAFPESYKPYLRELHNAHPEWIFEPFFTNLDFNEAVDNECGPKSLVSASVTSPVFKSKDAGDYDYKKDAYIYKDGGFVEANRMAVAYFMDPRNFLNADGIFMFETLSFNDAFTVEAVENVLKGSFMANAKIQYYNSDGKLKKTSKKYSTVIFEAGKKYNVNPCYLASKILNEVGMSGSSSVSGKYSTYPGIYNFYNIGATDGAGAIARGLKWASSGDTYSRPWNTPEKSINGGAEYIAQSYIACGQFTGYLQRFNVNVGGKHTVYTHQYMTNLTGALSQGYSTYTSYVSSGLLDNKYVFSIPVYENMPSGTDASDNGRFVDSLNQMGTVSATSSFVRSGPSTYYGKVLDNTGAEIKITYGTPVSVLEKIDTDSDYYLSLLQYPYWYKISFIYNGVAYEGYLPESFVDISTQITVKKGDVVPAISVSNSDMYMELISYDCNIAQITEDNKIKFLKSGTVDIATYDSSGNFDKVRYFVSKAIRNRQTEISFTDVTTHSATVNFKSLYSAIGYEIVVIDKIGNIIRNDTLEKVSPYMLNDLEGAAEYNVCIRAIYDDSEVKEYGPFVSSILETQPDTVNITTVAKDENGKVTINWKHPGDVDGYEVFVYDAETKTYTQIDTVPAGILAYTIPDDYMTDNRFALRGFEMVGESILYGAYSKVVNISRIPGKSTVTAVNSVTDDGYTIKWKAVDGAYYRVYKEVNGVFVVLDTVDTTSYTVSGAGPSAYTKHKIAACKKVSGIVYEGISSKVFSATSTPEAVKNLKVSATNKGGKFTWDSVKNAKYYIVYIYSQSKGKYVEKAQVKTNSYTMSDRKPGKKYKISVKACISTTYSRNFGEADYVSFYTSPDKVTGVKFSSVKTDSLKISWKKASAADKYSIYQYNSKKKKYIKIGETVNLSYTIPGLSAGTTYRFKIKSVKLAKEKAVSTNTSSVYKMTTKPGKVRDISAKAGKTSITLSWGKVNGATDYQVYMYDSEKKKYVRITTVEDAVKYKVKGLEAGKKYKFKLRAYKTYNGKNYFGAYSKVYTFKTKS